MFETGISNTRGIAEEARGLTCASTARTHNRNGLKSKLCGGVAAAVFMLALLAPVSIDFATGEIIANAAQAGNGDGNYGKGKGNGGPNDQNPGGGKGDDGDDGGGAGDGDGDGALPTTPQTEEGGGRDPGADAAADMAEADFAEAVDAVAGAPAEGPMAGTPATTLPTISQVFSMGDEATVSAKDELELIANGWGAPN